MFSVLKAHIKKLLRTKYYEELLASAKKPWGSKGRAREKIINDALIESIPYITKKYMEQLWDDMLKVFGRVYNNEDI